MRPIKLLGICGSPRKGNSEFLLDQAMEAACAVAPALVASSRYSFKGKKFSPCLACGKCGENGGNCIIKDSYQELSALWHEADAIIYSVPVYHMGMPGQVKCFIDRLGNEAFGKYSKLYEPGKEKLPKLLKIIGSVAQGIHFGSGQESTLTALNNHALLMQCIPITGDLWQAYIGGTGWTLNDPGRDALKKQYEENNYDANLAVQSAKDIGRRAVEFALILREGGLSRKGSMVQDPSYQPFIERITKSE